jgi:hypothetical protein
VRLTAAAKAVRYRIEQFLRALTAQQAISERRLKRATEILSPEARALFVRQAPQDQRHALDVYETLLKGGHTHEDLLRAALLHDVGKAAAQAPPWQRGIFVLAKCFTPRTLGRMLRDVSKDRSGSLVAYANHAEIGARWAEEAGCSALTVALIRHHEDQPETYEPKHARLLVALQAADSVN